MTKLNKYCAYCEGTGKVKGFLFFKKRCESCNGEGYYVFESVKPIAKQKVVDDIADIITSPMSIGNIMHPLNPLNPMNVALMDAPSPHDSHGYWPDTAYDSGASFDHSPDPSSFDSGSSIDSSGSFD